MMTQEDFHKKAFVVMRHPLFVILMFVFGWYLYLYGIAGTRGLPLTVQMSLGFGGLIIGYIMGAVMEKFAAQHIKLSESDETEESD